MSFQGALVALNDLKKKRVIKGYKGSTDYLQRFKEARAARAKKLEGLPFAKKVDIIEKIQAEARLAK